MKAAWWSGFLIVALSLLAAPGRAQTPDDSLMVYAVKVVKTPPFKKPETGDGIYLGQGLVITAAHVVGSWPFFTHPRVQIAGQDLAAAVIKKGSFAATDLALLSIAQSTLPVSLRLRRNPLCRRVPPEGAEVINVAPEGVTRARIVSPLLIAPQLRNQFGSLIDTPEGSGSGLFEAGQKCLLGIMSAKIQHAGYALLRSGRVVRAPSGFAGYFVPAGTIANFLPANLRY
jgi:hypothetical protein